jgi:hypothetical protein
VPAHVFERRSPAGGSRLEVLKTGRDRAAGCRPSRSTFAASAGWEPPCRPRPEHWPFGDAGSSEPILHCGDRTGDRSAADCVHPPAAPASRYAVTTATALPVVTCNDLAREGSATLTVVASRTTTIICQTETIPPYRASSRPNYGVPLPTRSGLWRSGSSWRDPYAVPSDVTDHAMLLEVFYFEVPLGEAIEKRGS